MNEKEITKRIELVQGDTSDIYKFQRKYKDGTVIKTKPQKMWITFKKDCRLNNCVLQKTLEKGIEFNEEDYYYRFQLLSGDTCDLIYGTYGFDIAIINEDGKKKTLLKDGELEIDKHYTKKCNEV